MTRERMVKEMTEFWLGLSSNEVYPEEDIHAEVRERMSQLLVLLEYRGLKPPVKKQCPVLLRDEFMWEKENAQE